jgi:hypothetical protein
MVRSIILMLLLTGCTTTRQADDHNQHWMFCVGACVSLKDDKDQVLFKTERKGKKDDGDVPDGLFTMDEK